jgi:hypothetical protein
MNLPDGPNTEAIDAVHKRYLEALGRVAFSWNCLHEVLGQLFATMVGSDRAVALAIWHSTRSDLAQRDMLRETITVAPQAKLAQQARAREDLKSFLDKIDRLAEHRNDAIHAPVAPGTENGIPMIFPTFYSGNRRARNLKDKDVLTEFAWYEQSANILRAFAGNVNAFFGTY